MERRASCGKLMRKSLTTEFRLLTAWWISSIVLATSTGVAVFHLSIGGMMLGILFAVILVGFALFILVRSSVALMEARAWRHWMVRFAAAIIVFGFGAISYEPLIQIGRNGALNVSFALNRRAFGRVVEDLENGVVPEKAGLRRNLVQVRGIKFYWKKKPIRVAFPVGSGFLSMWEGIVYDPSGDLDPEKENRTQGSSNFYDNGIGDCRRLDKSYYHCFFY
jgi:hypothetical protein